MARPIHKLTDRQIRAANAKGRVSDGGGLYLRISPTGSKSWSFMWNRDKRRREIGLGAYPDRSLASARDIASRMREAIGAGSSPLAVLNSQESCSNTFAACVDAFLAAHESAWRNEKHRWQWRSTLETYGAPLMKRDVSDITIQDVRDILLPIWLEKHETASRLRGRIERVIDYAIAEGWRTQPNPAIWRGGLKGLLPAVRATQKQHFPAMDYREVPAFMDRIRGHEALAARALEFVILTAGRTGEVINATWDEIDLDEALWTIPGRRMKAGRTHVVPLSEPAIDLLRKLSKTKTGDFIFEGQKPGRPMSQMAMLMLLRRMKLENVTVHGFRSSFRDWAGNETSFAREVAEACLAHEVGSQVERSYRRQRALDKQRDLLRLWATYISKAKQSENVVALHG
ncbi:MAG: integrase arm-type DNA-binding domain-containing protein [Pseudomonadota bacterium]